MRILWQSFVDAAQNAPYLERLSRYLNEIAAPGTSVEVLGISPPDRDFGRLTEFRCFIRAVDDALGAEQQGFDGFVVGHFQDPGLYEARSALRVPVIGTGEATIHFASQLRRRSLGCGRRSSSAPDRWSRRAPTSSCRPVCCRVCCWPASAASSSTVRRSSIAPRWRSKRPRWGSA